MVSAESFSFDALVADLEALVTCESPSRDLNLLTQHAELLARMMERLLGSRPTLIESPVGPHIHWVGGPDPRVLILGHHDTVHPVGTLARLPFTTDGGIGRGPGVFDMKAGIVQALHAVAALADTSHIEILLSADEEIGSRASRELI